MSTPAPARYTASVPVLRRYLGRLRAWVDVAETAGPTLLQARLAPDMLPWSTQVAIAAHFALRACCPVSGRAVPPFGDFPPTCDGLRQRIDRAAALIEALPPADFAFEGPVADMAGQAQLVLPPDEYLHQYALPNFFFHATAAYHVLRHAGLPVGKALFDGYHVYPPPGSVPIDSPSAPAAA